MGSRLSLLPGLGAAIVVALVSRFLHGQLPPRPAQALGEVLIAVVLGLVVGNLVVLPPELRPGLRFAFQGVLRFAIVLLGASLSLAEIGKVGGSVLLLIVLLMTLALGLGRLLGRWLGIPPRLTDLIGVGTAICGNSAISATAPVIGARDEEVSFAIATNTLFGTLAVLCYPLLAALLGLSPVAYGIWAGTAVNDTSQVVAAGFAVGDLAGKTATTVKLTRNALMGPMILLMGWLWADSAPRAASGPEPASTPGSWQARLRQSLPTFVLGFVAMAALRSLGVFDWLSTASGFDVVAAMTWLAKLAILVALAAVGLTTRFADLRRIGLRPFLLGLAVATVTSLVSLTAILLVLRPAP